MSSLILSMQFLFIVILYNNYSLKAKWILVNKNRDEVEVVIPRYSLSMRWIIVQNGTKSQAAILKKRIGWLSCNNHLKRGQSTLGIFNNHLCNCTKINWKDLLKATTVNCMRTFFHVGLRFKRTLLPLTSTWQSNSFYCETSSAFIVLIGSICITINL